MRKSSQVHIPFQDMVVSEGATCLGDIVDALAVADSTSERIFVMRDCDRIPVLVDIHRFEVAGTLRIFLTAAESSYRIQGEADLRKPVLSAGSLA